MDSSETCLTKASDGAFHRGCFDRFVWYGIHVRIGLWNRGGLKRRECALRVVCRVPYGVGVPVSLRLETNAAV